YFNSLYGHFNFSVSVWPVWGQATETFIEELRQNGEFDDTEANPKFNFEQYKVIIEKVGSPGSEEECFRHFQICSIRNSLLLK
ncbi:MAG: hypothetical protein K2X86_07210, partial [Cytophagaceae bacterium]|nr:hypothetical protein [Cytophagaceae bacterium]